ncbi:MAG: hypothetical protein QOD90_1841 [Mycobacterium sp.]|jgi:hypothetical protein|nr:hypothetical protein [Mycobacterium sp.]
MTSLTMPRPWSAPTLRNAMVVRQGIAWADYVNAVALIFRPVVVTLGIAAAAVMWPSHANADVATDSGTSALNGVGIGNNGPVSTAIAGAGQSICPMLVQPGSQLATMAAQVSGQSGLAPTIAGWVATMVIQTQCPGWMTSLSNGQMPAGLNTLTNVAGPALGLPSTTPGSQLPFALPGATPASPGGLQIPGL